MIGYPYLKLAGIDGLARTDGNFIVGDGSSWVAESGATARTSIGLGTANSPTFAGCSIGTGELTAGSINRATGTLTLEIGGSAIANISTTGLGIGGAATQKLDVIGNANSGIVSRTYNSNSGTAAYAGGRVEANGGSMGFYHFSSGYTTASQYIQDGAIIEASAASSGGLSLSCYGAHPIKIWSGQVLRATFEADGDLLLETTENGSVDMICSNPSTGTSAQAMVQSKANAGTISMLGFGSGKTTSNQYIQDSGLIEAANMSGGLGLSVLGDYAMKFWVNSTLEMTLDSTALKVDQDIWPATDDTYYLGKNDDDTPFAWKGLILKDTNDGKYYRIQLTNGAVDIVDLTD